MTDDILMERVMMERVIQAKRDQFRRIQQEVCLLRRKVHLVKYRRKPVLTEATQWFTNGDHPQDDSARVERAGESPGLSEGKVVRYFRRLNIPGGRRCPNCSNIMQRHGLLDGLNGEEIVCPGDYIVTDRKGRYYRLSAADFEAQYEPYIRTPHPTEKKIYR